MLLLLRIGNNNNILSASELHKRLIASDTLIMLDVRESFELDICRLKGALHIPMSLVPSNIDKLPKNQELVVLCHHGIRSAQIVGYLKQNGFDNVHNLDGGIHAWAMEVDNNMAVY